MGYLITDCAAIAGPFETDDDLSAFVGNVIRVTEYPGICFTVSEFVGPANPHVSVSPIITCGNNGIYADCAECIATVNIPGCTDPEGCNYDPCANFDDGTCTFARVNVRINCDQTFNDCQNC